MNAIDYGEHLLTGSLDKVFKDAFGKIGSSRHHFRVELVGHEIGILGAFHGFHGAVLGKTGDAQSFADAADGLMMEAVGDDTRSAQQLSQMRIAF